VVNDFGYGVVVIVRFYTRLLTPVYNVTCRRPYQASCVVHWRPSWLHSLMDVGFQSS